MAQDRVEAVERALSILSAFKEPGEMLSLAEIATRTSLYKSTILRLLGSLSHFEYVVRSGDGHYKLGPAAGQLGGKYRSGFAFSPAVRSVLADLRDKTGETASIYVRDGDSRVCLFRANSVHAMRHHLDEGSHFSLRQGAAGKVLCAWSEPDNPEYAKERRQGFAHSLGERDPDIGAIAVPLFRGDAELIGALSLSGVLRHFDTASVREAMLSQLQAAARQLHG